MDADHVAGEAKPWVGRPPDFSLQIQEAGGMTYDAMREMTAGLVQCGRKMQTAGPRATCSQRIRTARSYSLKQGRQDEAHRWANCWRSADDGLCRRVRHAAHDTKHPGRPRAEQDIRSL